MRVQPTLGEQRDGVVPVVDMRLWDLAHARAGDKGDSSILLLHPYDEDDYPGLRDAVTPELVAGHFSVPATAVSVVPCDGLRALTVVVRGRLDGGVTRSPRVDPHGKTLSGHLLDLVIRWRGRAVHGVPPMDDRTRTSTATGA